MTHLDHGTSAETSSQVGWAGQDVAEMLVPHVRVAALLHEGLDLGQALAETTEDTLKGGKGKGIERGI